MMTAEERLWRAAVRAVRTHHDYLRAAERLRGLGSAAAWERVAARAARASEGPEADLPYAPGGGVGRGWLYCNVASAAEVAARTAEYQERQDAAYRMFLASTVREGEER